MATRVNGAGVRIDGSASTRVSRADKATRQVAAVDGSFQRAESVPATRQWRCEACGHPNLERYVVCGACGEERDIEKPDPKEVA